MKLASLLYYFFGGVAQTSGSATYDVTQTNATGTAAVVVSEEDSRGWFRRRFHAVADVAGVDLSTTVGHVYVTADAVAEVTGFAVAEVTGFALTIDVGILSAEATSVGDILSLPELITSSGQVGASATAVVEIQSTPVVNIKTGKIRGRANSIAEVTGSVVKTAVGYCSVEIGPDLVQEEDEEMLFLLEVA
jgi:hypothetical protein